MTPKLNELRRLLVRTLEAIDCVNDQNPKTYAQAVEDAAQCGARIECICHEYFPNGVWTLVTTAGKFNWEHLFYRVAEPEKQKPLCLHCTTYGECMKDILPKLRCPQFPAEPEKAKPREWLVSATPDPMGERRCLPIEANPATGWIRVREVLP